MTLRRPGFRTLFVQIPDSVWAALLDDAEARGESVARLLTAILCRKYHIPPDSVPKPRRPGRKPKGPAG
jgi:hypothetical protein